MSINVKLFKKVRDKILATPEAYDQGDYGRPDEDAPCGTVACIAGWAVVLSGKSRKFIRENGHHNACLIHVLATKKLGLTENEARTVFFGGETGWPEKYSDAFRRAKSNRGEARAAANYINYIIRTGKVE